MRVMHVIGALQAGGAEALLFRLVTSSTDVRHEVVSIGPPDWYSARLAEKHIIVHHLNRRSAIGRLFAIFPLYRLMKRTRPDVVQGWMYLANLLAGLAAKAAGIPVLWSIHCAYLGNLSAGTGLIVRVGGLLARRIPSRVINCSAVSARTHQPLGYAADKVALVPNGYDVANFRPDDSRRRMMRAQLGIAHDCFLIGTVARWHIHKDPANLVAALVLFEREVGPGWRCALAGHGLTADNSELAALLAMHGVAENCLCLGVRDDMPDLMRALDVHVLPSREEAFPNTVAESMASGAVPIATDVGDTALIVGDTGWIVPPRDAPALAAALAAAYREWIGDKAAWQARSTGARRRIVDNFAFERMASGYLEEWKGAIAAVGAKRLSGMAAADSRLARRP